MNELIDLRDDPEGTPAKGTGTKRSHEPSGEGVDPKKTKQLNRENDEIPMRSRELGDKE